MKTKMVYSVYDSRAQYDIDSACCLEALGCNYTENDLKNWSGQGAVLVGSTIDKDKIVTYQEVIKVID